MDGVRADAGDGREVYVYVGFLDGAGGVKGGGRGGEGGFSRGGWGDRKGKGEREDEQHVGVTEGDLATAHAELGSESFEQTLVLEEGVACG